MANRKKQNTLRPTTIQMGPELDLAEKLWRGTILSSRADLIRRTLQEHLEETAERHKEMKE